MQHFHVWNSASMHQVKWLWKKPNQNKTQPCSLYQALSAPRSFQHCCFSLAHPPLGLPGPARWNANPLWSGLHYQWLWRLPVWGSWLRETRGLRVQEASPQRTEKSPGIPPALMRSIPVRRTPQAASTRWNARPLSLTAWLRAISNSLSEWLTGEFYQLGDSWYVCYCQTLFEIALLSFTVAFGFYLCSRACVCVCVGWGSLCKAMVHCSLKGDKEFDK